MIRRFALAALGALTLAIGLMASGAEAAAQESGWSAARTNVYADKADDGDMCLTNVLLQSPDGEILAVSAGVTKRPDGLGFLKITGTLASGPGLQTRTKPDTIYLSDPAGDATEELIGGGDASGGGMRQWAYELDANTWAVVDAIGREGRYDIHFRLPGGEWRVVSADITKGRPASGVASLTSDPAANPAAFAACVAGMGIAR